MRSPATQRHPGLDEGSCREAGDDSEADQKVREETLETFVDEPLLAGPTTFTQRSDT